MGLLYRGCHGHNLNTVVRFIPSNVINVYITSNVVSLILACSEVYTIQFIVIKFVPESGTKQQYTISNTISYNLMHANDYKA